MLKKCFIKSLNFQPGQALRLPQHPRPGAAPGRASQGCSRVRRVPLPGGTLGGAGETRGRRGGRAMAEEVPEGGRSYAGDRLGR